MNKEHIKKHTIDLILSTTALEHDCVLVSSDKIYCAIQFINEKFIFENWA